uniref:Uncharacterized protein n=1 Tax=Ditylenchus dipsaci TaxID=166011 RepID=A0A915DCL9_9BILA
MITAFVWPSMCFTAVLTWCSFGFLACLFFYASSNESITMPIMKNASLRSDENDSSNEPLPSVMTDSIVYSRPQHRVKWKEFDTEAYLEKGKLKPDEDRYAANKFNQAASDAVSVNRSIPDSREKSCQLLAYNVAQLPPTSIIITFHNEARSTLLRTVMTAFARSPPGLLRESFW